MTITADSDNTFGNLVIANGNGNNDDKFALRLDGGKALSQTSTALGTGSVTLKDNLILRLAGTGTANQSHIEYTYANNIAAGNASTIQSYNITNKLSGAVTMAEGSESSLNLATANGGVLHLAGGLVGSGTLNLGAASEVILGAGASEATFSGKIVAAAGANLTLEDPTATADTISVTGTDSFTLGLLGTEDYTLGGILMNKSEGTQSSALTLHFDFSDATLQDYTTLFTSNIVADAAVVDLTLNLLGDLEKGEYVLIDGVNTTFTLADNQDGRFSLRNSDGKVILTVGNDTRFLWSSSENNGLWNTGAANWKKDGTEGTLVYVAGSDVMLNASGQSLADSREIITVNDAVNVGKLSVNALYGLDGTGSLNGTALTVADGDLTLGVDASFSEGVRVNAGTLTVENSSLTANVTAEANSKVTLNGTGMTGNISVNQSTVTLNQATLTGNIAAGKGASVSMDSAKLRGEINFADGGRIVTADNSNGTAHTLATLSGAIGDTETRTLSLIDGTVTLDGPMSLDALSIAAGKTLTVWNNTAAAGAEKHFATVELGAGATLQSNDRAEMTSSIHLGAVRLNGNNAVIQDKHHSGSFTIDSLHLGSSVTDSTLTLRKNAASTWSTVFKLGNETDAAGNFAGTIALSESNNGGKRSAFIILGNADIAQNAVISLKDAQSSDAHIGLGINTSKATIAGIESAEGDRSQAKLFSGYIGEKQAWNTGDTSAPATVGKSLNTLTINTAAGGNYTFHGEVMSNLNLVKTGEGKQTFSGNSANFNGSIELQNGTLAFTGNAAGMLSTASGVSIRGGELDLSALSFNAGGSTGNTTFVLAENAVFSFSGDGIVKFGNMAQGTVYNIFSLSSGGILEGWETLSAANFSVNGTLLSTMGRVDLQLGLGGTFSYTLGANKTLYWDGAASGGLWDFSSAAWGTFANGEAADNEGFYRDDSVVFDSDAAVTVSEGVRVTNLSLSAGTRLTTTGEVEITGTVTSGENSVWTLATGTEQHLSKNQLDGINALVVATGATLTVSDSAMAGFSASNISGEGTVELALSGDAGSGWANDVNLGDGFKGETYITSGSFDLSGAKVGSVLRLADGVNSNSADAATTLTANLILEGASIIHANGNKPIVYDGTVTGANGVFISNGSSSHTFKNEVALKEFRTAHSGNTNTFEAKTSLDKAVITQATVNFAGVTCIDEAVISGGTTNLSGTAELKAVSLSGGTLNVNGHTEISGKLAGGTGGTLATRTGELTLSYAGEDGNSVHILDGAIGGTASGSTRLAEGVRLNVTNQLWGVNGSSVILEKNAALTRGSIEISNRNNEDTVVASSHASGTTYDASKADWTLTNGHIKSLSSAATTLGNRLTNSSVENAGSGLLTVSNAGNTISGLSASGGDIKLANQANELVLGELIVGAGKTLSAYKGTEETEVNEATIRVTGTAEFGAGARLNADLVLASGATLEVSAGGVIMGSTVTLEQSVSLGASALEQANALVDGGKMVLFTGVDGLILGSGDHAKIFNVANDASEENYLSASDYFSNLGNNSLLLYFSGEAGGTFGLLAFSSPIPEPSAFGLLAGLSALALAGSRRRRGKRA